MLGSREYRFTSKSRSDRGVMSSVCGTISLISLAVTVLKVIRDGGQAAERMGAAGFVSFLFCLAGLILGIISLMEKDKFLFFPRLGFILSLISGIAWGAVLYVGFFTV